MKSPQSLHIRALTTLPEFFPGDDLARAILDAAQREGLAWRDKTIVVIAQKVVSKVEGKIVDLRSIQPSQLALTFGERYNRDPRLVELILKESRQMVKTERGILITETRHGFVCANAGIDQSNVPGSDNVTVLPDDPDASARAIRDRLTKAAGVECAVIISDTFGRPWRVGLVDVAIGVAGLQPVQDSRGKSDRQGRTLKVTAVALADQLAAAAGVLMQKTAGQAVVLVQGLAYDSADGGAGQLLRKPEEDLFR